MIKLSFNMYVNQMWQILLKGRVLLPFDSEVSNADAVEEEATAMDFDDDEAWADICCEDTTCDVTAWELLSVEYCDCSKDEDCTVADSILDVISATSAEWADASMVEIAFSWWVADALLVAELDLEEDFTAIDDDEDETSWDTAVDDVFLAANEELLSSEKSLWETILSFDMVLLLTNGDFCASSWLAFKSDADAAKADSCLLSEALMAAEDE